MRKPFQLSRNLTILGAPGSGKGFYGKPISASWGVPLLTASSILRESKARGLDLDSGKLVECETVSSTILSFISKNDMVGQHYILDGFPRTKLQIELMERTWPTENRIHGALLLDVPDFVCRSKMLGRRHCSVCDRGFNVAAVHQDGFDLPPQLPKECTRCNPHIDWTRRRDDTETIIDERLRLHREHEQPIISHYASRNALMKYRPFHGEKDVPDMQEKLEIWIDKELVASRD